MVMFPNPSNSKWPVILVISEHFRHFNERSQFDLLCVMYYVWVKLHDTFVLMEIFHSLNIVKILIGYSIQRQIQGCIKTHAEEQLIMHLFIEFSIFDTPLDQNASGIGITQRWRLAIPLDTSYRVEIYFFDIRTKIPDLYYFINIQIKTGKEVSCTIWFWINYIYDLSIHLPVCKWYRCIHFSLITLHFR